MVKDYLKKDNEETRWKKMFLRLLISYRKINSDREFYARIRINFGYWRNEKVSPKIKILSLFYEHVLC